MVAVIMSMIAAARLLAADTSESEESLLFMDIPPVVTASKMSQSIDQAPSIVYVVTSDEIKRWGSRTLADVFKRVPGFNVNVRETSDLGSRGFTSDQIDKFVWMVDGVQLVNIMQDGPWGIMDIPDMDMVDHIEIVKGPSSTLWGSSASLGVINVITKKGSQINGCITSISGSSRDMQGAGNVLYGGKTGTLDYMFSFTYTKSQGYNDTNDGFNKVYYWGGTTQNTTYDNYQGGNAIQNGHNGNLLVIQPTWEFYGKLVDDSGITMKARASYTRENYLWGSNNDDAYQDVVYKHEFFDVGKDVKYSKFTDIEYKASFHNMSYDRGVLDSSIDPLAVTDVETKIEMGLNLEAVLKTVIADNHYIVAGIKDQNVQYGPSQREQFMVGSGSTTLNGGYPNGYKYVYVTPAGEEDVWGAYIEDTYKFSSKLSLVGGISYENDDDVYVGGKVMPRFSAIYAFNNNWSAKYCYNTGYERPPVDKEFHKMFGHVTQPENVQETDAELTYNNGTTRFTATGFSYQINNWFAWSTVTNAQNVMIAQGQYNTGSGTSVGGEFDLRHNFSKKLSFSGNFTCSDTKMAGAYSLGDPRDLYNYGIDYNFAKNVTLNVNVNGWIDMPNGYPNNGTWGGGGDEIVDATAVFDNVFAPSLTVTIFAKNMFNVMSPVGMTSWPGYTYAEGSSYGVKLGYKFF